MENIVTRINIDLHSPAVYEVVKAQQNDTNSRIIEVILTNNGKPYPLNEVSTIKFSGHRSDGSSFEQDCTYTDDLITIVLKEDILGLHGLHEGRITLYGSTNNQILSTPAIKISVQKDPCFDKDNITEIPRNKIDETILEIGSYEEKLNQHIADVDIHPTKEEMESAIKKEVEQNINDLQEKIDNLEEEIGKVDATPENVVLYANDGEVVDVPTIDDNGMTVNITVDSELSETSENPVQNKIITAKLNEVFTSVSNGKDLIASAITDSGITISSDATFSDFANAILNLRYAGYGLLNKLFSAQDESEPYVFFSSYEGNRYPYLAFDGIYGNSNTTIWSAQYSDNITGEYIGYKFDSPTYVNTIRYNMNGDYSLHKYKWQASYDGEKWIDLTEEDESYASGRNGYKTHILYLEELGTAGTYQYYRLYYTAGQIGASYGTAIGEIELRFD